METDNVNTRPFWNNIWESEGSSTWRLYPTCFGLICKILGNGRRVLDVGCGVGVLAARMRAAGNIVHGLDISDKAVRTMRRTTGIHGFAACAPPIPCRDQSYDFVVSTETLEHFQEPDALVAEMARVGRHALIGVPDQVLSHDDIEDHYQMFTEDTLKALLERHYSYVRVFSFVDSFTTPQASIALPTLLAACLRGPE